MIYVDTKKISLIAFVDIQYKYGIILYTKENRLY